MMRNLPFHRSWMIQAMFTAIVTVSVAACGRESEPDPDNELPFGTIDTPTPGAVVPVGSSIQVAGWALDDSAVREVRVYIDARFRTSAFINADRPDLAGSYASYLHGTNMHGWGVIVEMPNAPGTHTLLAQAVDDRGATRDFTPVPITVQ